MSVIAEMSKEFHFEAAHFLPHVDKNHQCHKIHGHSFLITIRAEGKIDEKMGWIMDLNEISKAISPLLETLDHSFLNDIEGLENPTSENVAVWILTRLEKSLPQLSSVTVEATNRIGITVKRQSVF